MHHRSSLVYPRLYLRTAVAHQCILGCTCAPLWPTSVPQTVPAHHRSSPVYPRLYLRTDVPHQCTTDCTCAPLYPTSVPRLYLRTLVPHQCIPGCTCAPPYLTSVPQAVPAHRRGSPACLWQPVHHQWEKCTLKTNVWLA